MLVVGFGKCECRLVRRVEIAPTLGGAAPVTRELGCPWLGRADGNVGLNARGPAPVGELTDHPRHLPPHRQVEHRVGRGDDLVAPAFEPEGFRARHSHGLEPLQFPGRFG